MKFQPNYKEIVQFLDKISYLRYTKLQLQRKLAEFFKVEIELELEYREITDTMDDAFLFVIEGLCDVTIYFLRDKLGMYFITDFNCETNF